MDDDKRERLATLAAQRMDLYTSADSWALEALKHVALVGSGGVAGTFALLAATSPAVISKSDAVGPAAAFAAAVVLATLAMAAGYKQRAMAMEIYFEAEEIECRNADHSRYIELQDRVSVLAPIVDILGWLGFAADVLGGLLLFTAL